MMGIVFPETCWACNKICNKYHLLHLLGILFPRNNDDARSKSLQIYLNHVVSAIPQITVKILLYTVCCTIQYSTILYYTILYYTILYYTIIYYTILYCTILYYNILYYTILYYNILKCSLLLYIMFQTLMTFKNQQQLFDVKLVFLLFYVESLSLSLSLIRNVVVISTYFILRELQSLDLNYIYQLSAISELITTILKGLNVFSRNM